MDRRKKKKLLPLLALLVLLAALVLLLVLKKTGSDDTAEEDTEDESTEIEVLTLEDEDLDRIAFTCGDTSMSFVKNEDDEWVLEGEEDFPLKTSAVTSMVSAVSDITSEYELTEIDSLEDFGLAEPAVTIELSGNIGGVTIYVGDEYPYGSDRYIYLSNDPDTVYVASSSLYSDFTLTRADLFTTQSLPDFDSGDILSIMSLVDGYTAYDLYYTEDNEYDVSGICPWLLMTSDGDELAVDTDKIADILEAASSISFDETVDYRSDTLDEYGISTTSNMLTIWYEVAEETTVEVTDEETGETSEETQTTYSTDSITLLFGDTTEDGQIYVNVDGSDYIFLWDVSSLEELMLQGDAETYTSDYICMIPIAQTDTLTVTTPSYERTYTFAYETVTDEEGNETEDFIATIDGYTADETVENEIKGSYADLIGLTRRAILADGTEGGDLMLSVVFETEFENYPTYTVDFYEYNDSYWLAVVNGESEYTVDKRDVAAVIEDFE